MPRFEPGPRLLSAAGEPGDVGGAGAIYLDESTGAFYGPRGGTSTFGETDDASASSTAAAGYAQATKFTLGESGFVTKVNIWMTGGGPNGSGSQAFKAVIYTAGATDPVTLLAVSEEASVAFAASSSAVEFALATPVFLTAGDYYIGFVADTPQAAQFRTNTSGARRYSVDPYGDGPETTWSDSTGDASEIHAYATYIPWPLIGTLT